MKPLIILLLLMFVCNAYSQADSSAVIKVCFLYGSKPKRTCKNTEFKSFGGLHGGHVSIQAGDTDYGFGPTVMPVHLFPKRRRQSAFEARDLKGGERYSAGNKTLIIVIPVSQKQLLALDSLHKAYCRIAPYDYAFFGMRCASATQDILAHIGIVKRKSRIATILTAFYPKRLRKRLSKQASANGYRVVRTEGKPTRKWEKD